MTDPTEPRAPLTRRRVLHAAVAIADEHGVGALTMRRLAHDLNVEAMSLYHHVANKQEILDGIAEAVVDEINEVVPEPGPEDAGSAWRAAVRRRILAARQVLLRHPWAPAIIASRTTMTPAVIRYFDGLTGLLRGGGLSIDLVHHGLHALGSRALGFSQELFDATAGPGPAPEADPVEMLQQMATAYPHIGELLASSLHDGEPVLGWCDDQTEFEFGLDVVLDGLDAVHTSGRM